MGKLTQDKVYIDLSKDNYVLTRKNDNKQMTGSVIKFVEWNEDGSGKAVHDTPALGRSIVLDPHGLGLYKWMTTRITEIISETEFKTENSIYMLHKV